MKIKKTWEKIKNLPVICMFFNGTFSPTGSFLSIFFVIAVILFMCLSSSKVKLGEDYIEVSATLVQPVKVSYEDITDIQLADLESHVMGERASGFQSLFAVSGSYVNDEYGIYDVFFSKQNKYNLIIIRYTEYDAYLVFNLKTPAQTEEMYNMLLERTNLN